MPTDTQRLANFLKQIFKLDAIDSTDSQTRFASLDPKIDTGLAALNAATTTTGLTAAERQYSGVFDQIGLGVFGLGLDLSGDAVVLNAGVQLLYGNVTGSAALSAFQATDALLFSSGLDLARFGYDFASLGHVRSTAALTAVEAQLVKDSKTVAGDFALLGSEVTALSEALNPPTSAVTTVETPKQLLGDALSVLGQSFTQVGADVGGLTLAFGGGGGAGAGLFAATTSLSPPSVGTALATVHSDFLGVDTALQGLAAPIANLLLPSATPAT